MVEENFEIDCLGWLKMLKILTANKHTEKYKQFHLKKYLTPRKDKKKVQIGHPIIKKIPFNIIFLLENIRLKKSLRLKVILLEWVVLREVYLWALL